MNRRQRARKQERRKQHLVAAEQRKIIAISIAEALPKMDRQELRTEAEQIGIKVTTKMTKQQLIDAIMTGLGLSR